MSQNSNSTGATTDNDSNRGSRFANTYTTARSYHPPTLLDPNAPDDSRLAPDPKASTKKVYSRLAAAPKEPLDVSRWARQVPCTTVDIAMKIQSTGSVKHQKRDVWKKLREFEDIFYRNKNGAAQGSGQEGGTTTTEKKVLECYLYPTEVLLSNDNEDDEDDDGHDDRSVGAQGNESDGSNKSGENAEKNLAER